MRTILKIQNKFFAAPDLDLLLAHAINQPREFLYAHPEYRISFTQYLKFRYYLSRRTRGVPLAYITGHKEFFGLDFLVNKHTLVPRPETELLVEEAIRTLGSGLWTLNGNQSLKSKDQSPITLIDVGTGSGCIPISIAKTIEQFNNLTIFAADISRPALRIARKNAKRHGVDVTFLRGNLLEPFIKKARKQKSKKAIEQLNNQTIIITANLPYGWLAWKNESSAETKSLKFEPNKALFTGDSGLELIKKLLKQIKSLISQFPNFSISVLLEHDPRQTELLKNFIAAGLPGAEVETKTDLAGRDRVTKVHVSSLHHA